MNIMTGPTETITIILRAIDQTKAPMQAMGKRVKSMSIATRETLARLAADSQIGMDRLRGALSRVNLAVDKQGRIIDTTTARTVGYKRAVAMLTFAQQRFHMEWLSTMFAGMALERAMTNLLTPAFKLYGITELISDTLAYLFMPVADTVLNWVLKFSDWVANLSDEQKKYIGSAVLVAAAVGFLIYMFSQLALGLKGIQMVIASVRAASILGGTGLKFMGLAGWQVYAVIGVLIFAGLVIKRVMDKMGISIWDVVDAIADALIPVIKGLAKVFQWVWSIVDPIIDAIAEGIIRLFNLLRPVLALMGRIFAGRFAALKIFGLTRTERGITAPPTAGAPAATGNQFNTYNIDADMNVEMTGVEDPKSFTEMAGEYFASALMGKIFR